MPNPDKAYIEGVDGARTRVEFAFNPKEYTIAKRVKFKRTEQKGKDVPKLVMVDSGTEGAAKKPRPQFVKFGWGNETLFKSLVSSVDVTYTMFHPDGRPARAKVKVSLEEVPDQPSGQNPTSGGERGLRSHMVLPGETLDLIAYRELGDAARWHHIAETNGLDDPWSLRPGQRLAIVPVV